MQTKEEIRIIEGCRKGDAACQKMLYDTYGPMIKGVCQRYTSDVQEAEDLFHDIFIFILTHFEDYESITSLGGWLRRITINKAIDEWRRKQLHPSVSISQMKTEFEDNGGDVYDGIPMQVLLEHIQQLPPKYRTAFNLYVIDEIEQSKIAEMMNETNSNVRSLISRARTMLRKSIGKYLKNEQFSYE